MYLSFDKFFESHINETITVNDNPGPVCTVHEKKKKVAVVVALKSGCWSEVFQITYIHFKRKSVTIPTI